MELRTFTAESMQAALQLVRRELGPDAAVLQTREVHNRRLFGLLPGSRQVEVTASCDVNVPSRLEPYAPAAPSAAIVRGAQDTSDPPRPRATRLPGHDEVAGVYRVSQAKPERSSEGPRALAAAGIELPSTGADARNFHQQVQDQLAGLHALVEQLRLNSNHATPQTMPDCLFDVFTDLIEADVEENLARELLEAVRQTLPAERLDAEAVRRAVVALVESRISTCGPLRVNAGRRRVVALVGPTGVGKTTTIAKLAAHYRLREKRRVGLMTVDTYRIAAVDQLRTYADIIDLPMEVVSTPREVQPALERLGQQELILMDTAGRSPHDAVRIQELKAVLAEAAADEVHLVLSSVTSAAQLRRTADLFREVRTSAIIFTKLDEAASLGNMLGAIHDLALPLSYLTDGQNVPDDIEPAESVRLARRILQPQTTR